MLMEIGRLRVRDCGNLTSLKLKRQRHWPAAFRSHRLSTTAAINMAQNDTPPFDRSLSLKFTQTPNPQWTYGQQLDATPEGKAWLEGEKAGWKVVDTEKEDPMCVHVPSVSGCGLSVQTRPAGSCMR